MTIIDRSIIMRVMNSATFYTGTTLSQTLRGLLRWFGWYRRYGVRFNGTHEHTGFRSTRHAEDWARDEGCRNWVIFEYEPIDMRLPGGFAPAQRSSYKP